MQSINKENNIINTSNNNTDQPNANTCSTATSSASDYTNRGIVTNWRPCISDKSSFKEDKITLNHDHIEHTGESILQNVYNIEYVMSNTKYSEVFTPSDSIYNMLSRYKVLSLLDIRICEYLRKLDLSVILSRNTYTRILSCLTSISTHGESDIGVIKDFQTDLTTHFLTYQSKFLYLYFFESILQRLKALRSCALSLSVTLFNQVLTRVTSSGYTIDGEYKKGCTFKFHFPSLVKVDFQPFRKLWVFLQNEYERKEGRGEKRPIKNKINQT